MNLHKHARLTPRGRALLVQRIGRGLRVEDAAQAAGVSVRTAYKWLRRFREEGEAGLQDRSSRPKRCPHATSETLLARLVEQRRARKTYRQIASDLGLAVSTVARRLRKAGLHRLAELEPAPPVVRYEYAKPGDLLHLDIKKLGRFRKPGHRVTGDRQQNSHGAGWEFVHVAIDDASRIAFSSMHPDERGGSACRFFAEGRATGAAFFEGAPALAAAAAFTGFAGATAFDAFGGGGSGAAATAGLSGSGLAVVTMPRGSFERLVSSGARWTSLKWV